MEDSQFQKLLERFGLSWAGYRKVRKGVKKRLGRHMQEVGCQHVGEYIEAIERNPEVRHQFELHMTVSISRFFRDRGLWKKLEDQILPILAKAPQAVKIWSAGCASGEEVYSFRIVWDRVKKTLPHVPDPDILATDLCPSYLERARTAVYSSTSLKEVPETILSAYFEKIAGGQYALKPFVKDGISWQVHNLLSNPPGTAFDLIFLRNNLLTYYTDEVKMPAATRIVDALIPGGFLIIGAHETIPVELAGLKPWEHHRCVFQKVIR